MHLSNGTTSEICMTLADVDDKIFTNQTGWFPLQSSQGNKYIMTCYAYNWNAILTILIKNRTTEELL